MAIEQHREPEGEPSIPLTCPDCDKMVAAKREASYRGWDTLEGADGIDDSFNRFPALYVLYYCPSCSGPFLALYYSDGPAHHGEMTWDTHPHVLYPAPLDRLSASLLSRVGKAFEEACAGFECGTYTACVLMCRKALEGMCQELGVKDSNLAKSLAKMKDVKLIDDQLYRWADELRFAGNEAAHDFDMSVTREVASDVLDFCRAILQYTFTFRPKFTAFLKRRGKEEDLGL